MKVIARKHPLRDKTSEWEEPPGVTLEEIAKKIDPTLQAPIIAQVNGKPVDRRMWDIFKPADTDLINLRVMLAQGGGKGGGFGALAGLGLGAAGMGLMALLGRGNTSNAANQSATQQNGLAPPPDPAPTPAPAPVAGFGGQKDVVMPQITGVTNQANPYGPIPRVYGTYLMSPVVAANPFYVNKGNDQWMYAIFSCGYAPLNILQILIGGSDISNYVNAGVLAYQTGDFAAVSTIYTNDHNAIPLGVPISGSIFPIIGTSLADEISVDITFPDGLYKIDTTTYTVAGVYSVSGGLAVFAGGVQSLQNTANFTIGYRLAGSGAAWTTTNVSVTDNTPAHKRATFTIGMPARGVYDIYVQQTSGTGTSSFQTVNHGVDQNGNPTQSTFDLTWTHNIVSVGTATLDNQQTIRFGKPINTIKDANGATVPMYYIAVAVKASDLVGGSLSNLQVYCQSKLRSTDGSVLTAAAVSNNPADVLIDCLCGTINNSQLDSSYLDLPNIKIWKDYCTTNKLTYNNVVDSTITIPELLRQVASAGQASINVIDGKIGVVIDTTKPTVVQMFTMSNSDGLTFNSTWAQIPHGIKVNFVNPAANWQSDQRTVYDDGYTAANATIFETFDYVGVTNPTQAHKLARYHLAVARLRPTKYTLKVDLQHLICNRGDRVQINYDVILAGLSNGIVTSVTEGGGFQTSFTIDQAIFIDPSLPLQAYGVKIRQADGSIITQQIVNSGQGLTNTVTYLNPISTGTSPRPVAGCVVSFGYFNTEAIDMLVEAIQHNAHDLTATLTLVDYNVGAYSANTETIPDYTSNVSTAHAAATPVLTPPTITLVKSDESVLVRGSDGAYNDRIQLTIAPPVDKGIATIESQQRLNGSIDWLANDVQPVSIGSGTTAYIVNVRDGLIYDYRVRFADDFGNVSAWTTGTTTVIGKTSKPADVPLFELQNNIAVAKYDATAGVQVPLDLAGLRFKWAIGGAGTQIKWEDMNLLVNISTSYFIDVTTLPQGDLILAVKAVDVVGNESVNAAFLHKNIAVSYIDNIYSTVAENPAWTGTITGGAVDVGSGQIWANSSGTQFWNDDEGGKFWGDVAGTAFWGAGYVPVQYQWKYVPDGVLTSKPPFSIFPYVTVDADIYFLEYQRNSQSAFWGSDPVSAFWDTVSADAFWSTAGTGVWLPVPQGGLDGRREQYIFRVRCVSTSGRRSKIKTAGVVNSVATITEQVDFIAAANGGSGTVIPLTLTYRQIVSITLSLEYDAAYPNAVSASIDKSNPAAPVVRVTNASGTVIDGHVNVIVAGI